MKRSLIFAWLFGFFSLIFAEGQKQQTPPQNSNDTSMTKMGEEKVFRISSGMPASLDPSKATGTTFHSVYLGLFSGLLVSDPRTAAAIPGLAESWEVSEDGKTYTFLLRENLKWSDGVELTTEDFVYSWKRILNPETGSNYAWFPASVVKGGQDYLDGEVGAEAVGVKALDKRRFQVEFVSPLPYLVEMLTHYSFGAVPKHIVEKYGDDWVKPENYVSSGPYKMSDWRQNEYIELTANPYFYNQDQVTLDKIRFVIVEDGETAYSMYVNGEVDWLQGISAGVVEAVIGNPDAYIEPYLGIYYYNFNTQKPPFDDVRVRQAFALAIDKESLTNDVIKTGVIPTNSMVPPMEGYSESFPYKPEDLAENIAKAKQLLAEAGYPNGEGLPVLQAYYNTSEGHAKIAGFLQEQWRVNLGVEVELTNMEWKTFLDLRRDHDFDLARAGWIGDYRDPSTFLDLYVSNGGLNDPDYQSAEYDGLLEKARFSSGAERLSYLKQAEARLVNDYAVLPIYFYISTNMIDPDKWEGWYPNIMDVHYLINIQPKQ